MSIKRFIRGSACSFIFLIFSTYLAQAAEPRFSFPVDCEAGRDCWIVKYVDVEPRQNIGKDYHCGPHTHDDHKGTDIAIKDMITMEQGIAVKAAENGTVTRTLDNIDDVMPDSEDIAHIRKTRTACGNGVFIDHGEGWQTIYCHMKKGSLRVKTGDKVRRGEKIGKVGHSGLATFPHLHFGVFHNNRTIDPFTGHADTEGCGKKGQDLWRTNLSSDLYTVPALIAGGFSAHIPDFDSVRIDSYSPPAFRELKTSLFFWANYYGAQENDIINMEIIAPDGSVFAKKTHKQAQYSARQFYYIGQNAKRGLLQPGLYEGTITITRLYGGKPYGRSFKQSVYVGKQ